jgi:tripartite-type tricarboxylate transporter receptor subunit TctC
MPDAKEKLDTQGFVPFYNNPEQMAALLKADIAKYAGLIKAANIKSE